MTDQLIDVVDESGARVAVVRVTADGELHRGTIDLDATPPRLKRLFEEFEENVEGQMFSFADEAEEQIAAARLRIVLPGGVEAFVEDIHVYPSTGRVSFKVRLPLAVG